MRRIAFIFEISSYTKKPNKLKPLLETLIHLWLLYLHENEKLPQGAKFNKHIGKLMMSA
ncbi:MAG: hypothetical protein ACFFAS_04020 [Promethearchaeota archaeon]